MEKIIKDCVDLLNAGKVILYPTDTVWGIGCDATNAAAVQRIFEIKQRSEQKSMLILLDDAVKLPQYVRHVPDIAWDILPTITRPTTYIYPGAYNLPEIMIPADHTIAIRIVQQGFCHELLRAFQKPLVSTSANVSGMPSPLTFSEISEEIIAAMDFIIPESYCDSVNYKPSRMIRFLDNNDFIVIRE